MTHTQPAKRKTMNDLKLYLIELNENLNGELGTERTAIHHLIQSLRQAHPDRRSTVQFKRRHSPSPHTI